MFCFESIIFTLEQINQGGSFEHLTSVFRLLVREGMNKKKIFNDPVYGFISIPHEILFDLIEHPYMQRLRRIRQTGMSDFVYPGALHTRFHHALGAMHLMSQALFTLKSKGVEISLEESRAAHIAILLHDIGHGPFSHALEHTLLGVHHEELSKAIMKKLNGAFDGALTLAIEIFENRYHRRFLHQLVSGQLDMDRMDYLNRDSFFTGVAEGKIGYDRIIKMLSVADGELVVEEKGIYSIEKFLIARRLMYWQVYLHKAVLSAEHMLIQTLLRARYLQELGHDLQVSPDLKYFLENKITLEDIAKDEVLDAYLRLDDTDVLSALKIFATSKDKVLSLLGNGLVNRRLFRVELSAEPFDDIYIDKVKEVIKLQFGLSDTEIGFLVKWGIESNRAYDDRHEEIKISFKNGKIVPISQLADIQIRSAVVEKHFLFYPKLGVL
jgi:HD superfamily phosphohydrolase